MQKNEKNTFGKLRDIEAIFRGIFENAAVGISHIDLDGRWLRVNQKLCDMLGYTKEEMSKLNFQVITYAEDLPADLSTFEILKRGELESYSLQKRYIHKNGQLVWVYITRSLQRDTIGRPLYSITIIQDISSLKASEQLLRESEQRYLSLTNYAPVGIFETDTNGDCTYVNECWCQIAGISAAQALGKGWINGIHPEDRDRIVNDWYSNMPDEREFTSEYRFGTGQKVIWVLGKGKALYDQFGNKSGYLGIVVNITDHKRAENDLKANEQRLLKLTNELKAKNEEIESIINIASHDLRSPIVNIMGFSGELVRSTDTLKQKLLESKIAEFKSSDIMAIVESEIAEEVKYLETNTHAIDQMLRSLLKVTQIVMAEVHAVQVDMNDLIEKLSRDFEDIIKSGKIELTVEQLPSCYADPALVQEVFHHLISNAIKYLDPARPGKITIRGSTKNQYSIYSVEDNGHGIAPDHQKHIFKLFHRLEITAIAAEGIGLTIVKRLVNRMDGNVWLESQPDKGSKFFVALPNA